VGLSLFRGNTAISSFVLSDSLYFAPPLDRLMALFESSPVQTIYAGSVRPLTPQKTSSASLWSHFPLPVSGQLNMKNYWWAVL